MSSDDQHAKDVQDLRYLANNFDTILQNMRQCYEMQREQLNTLTEAYSAHVIACQEYFASIMTHVVHLERRITHLETGGVEDAPL